MCYLPKPPLNHFVNQHCRFGVIYLQYIYIIFLCLHWDAPKMYHDSSISIQYYTITYHLLNRDEHWVDGTTTCVIPCEYSWSSPWNFPKELLAIRCIFVWRNSMPYVSHCIPMCWKHFFGKAPHFLVDWWPPSCSKKKNKQILRHQDVRLISAFLKRYFNEGVRRSNESSLDGGWSPWLKHGIWMNLVAISW